LQIDREFNKIRLNVILGFFDVRLGYLPQRRELLNDIMVLGGPALLLFHLHLVVAGQRRLFAAFRTEQLNQL